jgi:cell division septal protein FtsQ
MNSPSPTREEPRSARLPRNAVVLLFVIIGVMALVALHANVQRWRRDKIETVIVTPIATPAPAAP